MSQIVFHHSPHWKTVSVTPGDTGWHQLDLSFLLPKSGRVNTTVAVCTLAAAGGAGSVALIDKDTASTPTVGFPVLGTIVFTINNTLWYLCTVGTDTIYFGFSW